MLPGSVLLNLFGAFIKRKKMKNRCCRHTPNWPSRPTRVFARVVRTLQKTPDPTGLVLAGNGRGSHLSCKMVQAGMDQDLWMVLELVTWRAWKALLILSIMLLRCCRRQWQQPATIDRTKKSLKDKNRTGNNMEGNTLIQQNRNS